MAKTFNVSFPPELAKDLDRAAKKERRSRSELLRQATRAYLEEQAAWNEFFRIGDQVRRELKMKPSDVNRIIDEYRQEKRQGRIRHKRLGIGVSVRRKASIAL